ncbi:hypothetical protein [Streptomyces sp. NBC_00996]
MTTGGHGHGADELCEAGLKLYARALREGRVRVKPPKAPPA